MDRYLQIKQLSDEELAGETRAGSRRCFDELVHRYGKRLFYFLRTRVPTDQDGEDLVQDTFIKAYSNIHRFDDQYKFSTWLYTTASRLAISHYRKNRDRDHHEELGDPAVHYPEPGIEQDDYDNMWTAARSLKPQQYQALWLRYMEDLSVKEIADVMNKSKLNVRVLLHRARSNLVKQYGQPLAEEAEQNAPADENGHKKDLYIYDEYDNMVTRSV